MTGKITFLVGLGAGYVLGARSGRERYEQIASKAQEVWRDPRVQEKAGQAQKLVKEKASEAGSAAAGKVSEKVGSGGSDSSSAATNGSSTMPASPTSSPTPGGTGGTLS
jgi:SLT domain-containing protein